LAAGESCATTTPAMVSAATIKGRTQKCETTVILLFMIFFN
jgi:hypothetical protein